MSDPKKETPFLPPAPPVAPTDPATRWRRLGALALIVVVTTAAYLPAMRGGLLWDDGAHVTKPELRTLSGLYRIWFDFGATQQYYPLLHSAFWVEHKLWGDATLGYHLVNVFLHASAACLVYLILRRLNVPGAYLAALIFALHPVHVESVAWISEQKNTLSAVFYLGAMLAYLRFREEKKSYGLYWLAFGLFVLGLLCKTVTATLPAALLVIFWWQQGRLSWERDVAPLLPWFALGAVSGLVTAWVERKLIGAEGAEFELSVLQRGLIAGRVVWFYLGKLAWPSNLIFIYPRWDVDPKVWWQWLFPVATLAVLIALVVIWRRWRAPLAGWLFFVGTLFPVLGFLNVYPFRYSFVADHFQYLASLGVIVLAAAGIALGLSQLPPSARPAGNALCVILLATLAVLTWRQSRMYSDVLALHQTTIDRNPNCWMAYYNLGVQLAALDRSQEAIQQYEHAIQLRPNFFEAHDILGIELTKLGRLQEAMQHFKKATLINPNDAEAYYNIGLGLASTGQLKKAVDQFRRAVAIDTSFFEAHNNLGVTLSQVGRTDDAIEHLERAVALKSDYADAHANLALLLVRTGRVAEGIDHYRQAILANPDHAAAHSNLGDTLLAQGKYEQAMTHYQKAVQLQPKLAAVRSNLGAALFQLGRTREAIEQYETALQLQSDNLQAATNLATAYAKDNRPTEAISMAQKAVELARSQGQSAVAQQIETWLANYRAQQGIQAEGFFPR